MCTILELDNSVMNLLYGKIYIYYNTTTRLTNVVVSMDVSTPKFCKIPKTLLNMLVICDKFSLPLFITLVI